MLSRTADRLRANLLLNSDFRLWQRGTSRMLTNGVSAYLADRWYARNALGANGVLTYSRQTGAFHKYAAQVQITTAPTASQANGCELWQVLENEDAQQLYDETASFHVQIRALGNVNRIGVQFFYATSETKPTAAIGEEQVVDVNPSGYVTALIDRQPIGTALTAAGVVGVRIRIVGVSAGNAYDLNNGFQVERAMLNRGAPSTWKRASLHFGAEVARCQRFFAKSYPLDVVPGTAPAAAGKLWMRAAATTEYFQVRPISEMRTVPSVSSYSPVTGTVNRLRNESAGADVVIDIIDAGTSGATIQYGANSGQGYSCHWTADAEI